MPCHTLLYYTKVEVAAPPLSRGWMCLPHLTKPFYIILHSVDLACTISYHTPITFRMAELALTSLSRRGTWHPQSVRTIIEIAFDIVDLMLCPLAFAPVEMLALIQGYTAGISYAFLKFS